MCDERVYFFFKTLSINNNIFIGLNLGNNRITDEDAKHLSQIIKTNKIFTHLSLGENKISDHRVEILANLIENHNTTIEWLDLQNNKSLIDSSVNSLLK